ncbi:response regulator [Candidatus Parcubacteria bacterium]|nr:MAG: response regulator [Candidatus Parcubacteria bacterium]
MTQSETPAASGKGMIMLVDDDKFLLDMYAMKFTQAGFSVYPASSTADALKVLREGLQPKAVLFDLIMPEGDGFYLLETIGNEKLAKGATFIALTNEMNDDEQKRIMELGASKYIVKAMLIPSEVVNSVALEVEKK